MTRFLICLCICLQRRILTANDPKVTSNRLLFHFNINADLRNSYKTQRITRTMFLKSVNRITVIVENNGKVTFISIGLSAINQSAIYLFIHRSIHPSIVHPSMYLSVILSIYPSTIYLSIISIYLSTLLSICVSVCVCLSFLLAYLFIYLFIWLSI